MNKRVGVLCVLMVVIASIALSPAGNAAPISSDLSLWIDAADTAKIAISNGVVTALTDKSSYGVAMTVLGAPGYLATGLNGRPAITFGGSDGPSYVASSPSFYATDRPQYNITTNMDFFAVAKFSGTNYQGILCKGNGGGWANGDNYIIEYGYPGASSIGAESSSTTDWGWVGSNPNVVSPGQAVIVEVSYDGARMDGQWQFFVNGYSAGYANNPNNYSVLHNTNTSALSIGRQGWWNPMNSDSMLSEVLLYQSTLNDSSRNITGAYLSEKYGIASAYNVPEPMTLLLLGLGGFALRRGRK